MARLIPAQELAELVPTSREARIGINAGAVIVQKGDYFGRTANIAARIADHATPREVLVSEDARQAADLADVEFELVCDVSLPGAPKSVRPARGQTVSV